MVEGGTFREAEPAPDGTLLAPGRIVGGRYEIERELGRGGMGAVYQARDRELDRRIALKVIRSDRGAEAEHVRRFAAEARATARLEHPGIVPVHDAGRDEAGRDYFTMKLVEGRTLASVIDDVRAAARRGEAAGEYTLFRLLEVVGEIARAVAYAHERGLLHRDLKPQNVRLGRYGEVQVMDWGLAKVVGAAAARPEPATATGTGVDVQTQETAAGSLIGTPAYMSPEQTVGDPSLIGPLADVFALGAILYHVLTGSAPYGGGTTAQVLAWAKLARPLPPRKVDPAIPEEVEAICLKAMAREHAGRYPSAQAFADDIQAYLEHRPVLARPPGRLQQARLIYRRNRALARVVAAAALVVLALSAAYVVRLQRERRTATERLGEILRLADVKRLADYEREAEALWPAWPGKVPALEDWLERARALAARLPIHRRKLDERATEGGRDDEALWERETLEGLVRGIERFAGPDPAAGGTIASVEARLAFARTVGDRTVGAHALAWDDAARAVAESPRYAAARGPDGARLALRPQVGLVPLGRDPGSGLLEFADLASGAAPARGTDGRLAIGPGTGVVLVLLPGGRFRMGASDGDPDAEADERPAHEVALAPYFAGKYEVTQGQWLRLAGSNPSQVPGGTPVHPVEGVSFDRTEAVLARAGLRPPTEAEWEFAARAGTATIHFAGDDPRSLAGTANLADRTARAGGLPAGRPHDDWLDDGHVTHAPVGSFRPNPFGLHDTAGNVWEWCDDVYGPYAGRPARAGDGRRPIDDPARRISRGGCFERPARDARSSRRHWDSRGSTDDDLGVRAARTVY